MARVRFFAQARQAASAKEAVIEGGTLSEVIDAVVERFGPEMGQVISHSVVWLNGERAPRDALVSPDDEVAVLPPVSGGG